MTRRRVACLVVALLTCNILVVQPLLACATHVSARHRAAGAVCNEMPPGVPTPTGPRVVATVGVPTAGHGLGHGPGHTHRAPECCEALGSCSPAFVMALPGHPPAPGAVDHRQPAARSLTAPVSRSTAPEPPPPRA